MVLRGWDNIGIGKANEVGKLKFGCGVPVFKATSTASSIFRPQRSRALLRWDCTHMHSETRIPMTAVTTAIVLPEKWALWYHAGVSCMLAICWTAIVTKTPWKPYSVADDETLE